MTPFNGFDGLMTESPLTPSEITSPSVGKKRAYLCDTLRGGDGLGDLLIHFSA